MNSLHLFFSRFARNLRSKYRNFRVIADWTVVVYFIIPITIIGVFIYRSWWVEGIPEWTMMLPASLYVLLGFLMAWNGSYRTFVEEGDRVFLIKHPKIFLNLKKWGFAYSLLYQVMQKCIFLILLLPFFNYQQMLTPIGIGSYFVFVIFLNLFFMHVKFQLKKINGKWTRIFASTIFFLVMASVVLWLANYWLSGKWFNFIIGPVMVGILSAILHYQTLKKPYLFDHHLAMEMEEKMKTTQMIFQLSFELEKPKIITRKKPWLFRNSKQIFNNRNAENGFLELFLKVFIRNDVYLKTFLQITSVTAAALVVVPPLWMKIVIFSAYLFMLRTWLDGVWEKIVAGHPFLRKYKELDSYYKAKNKGIRGLFFFSIIFHFLMVSVGLWIYDWFSNLL